MAVLGSLSGIFYPSRVQFAISVAKLANLDLVRNAAPCNKYYDVECWKQIGGSWFGSASGSSSNRLQLAFAHRLLHKQRRPLRLANCHRALHYDHSRNSLGLSAMYTACDAAAHWSRILRPRGSRADECTLLRRTSYAMPGWCRSSCCVCSDSSEHGCIQAKGVLQVTLGLIEVSGRSEISDAAEH